MAADAAVAGPSGKQPAAVERHVPDGDAPLDDSVQTALATARAWLDAGEVAAAEKVLATLVLPSGIAATDEPWAEVLVAHAEACWGDAAGKAKSIALYEQAAGVYHSTGNKDREGMVLCGLGFALLKSGGLLAKAIECLSKADTLAGSPAITAMLQPMIEGAKAQLAAGLTAAKEEACSGGDRTDGACCGGSGHEGGCGCAGTGTKTAGALSSADTCCGEPGGCDPSTLVSEHEGTVGRIFAVPAYVAATPVETEPELTAFGTPKLSEDAKKLLAASVAIETHIHSHAFALLIVNPAGGDPSTNAAALFKAAGGVQLDASDEYRKRYLIERHGATPAEPCLYFLGGARVPRAALEPWTIDGSLVDRVRTAGEAARAAAQSKIQALVSDAAARGVGLLFMKGTVAAPRCKFSKRAAAALQSADVRFEGVDVMSDWPVRLGLKSFANWKTLPQFYAAGAFVGGVDVLEEFAADGTLRTIALQRAAQ